MFSNYFSVYAGMPRKDAFLEKAAVPLYRLKNPFFSINIAVCVKIDNFYLT
jgi:hypothetical protein